jgi:hypothetical protein
MIFSFSQLHNIQAGLAYRRKSVETLEFSSPFAFSSSSP